MFDKQFMDFCYDQYKTELEDAERLYLRVSVLVAVLGVLGGIAVKLCLPYSLLSLYGNIPASLQTVLTVVTLILLGVSFLASLVFLFSAWLPRREYETVAPAAKWQEWHETYVRLLLEDKRSDDRQSILTQGFIDKLIPVLTKAQRNNVAINERRRRYYRKAVVAVMLATATTLMLGLLQLYIYLGALYPCLRIN